LDHQERAPHEDIDSEVVCRRESLHDQVGGDGPYEPAEVERAVSSASFDASNRPNAGAHEDSHEYCVPTRPRSV
jgi:hypothetical protein